ncbi:MAG: rhomboid family intramembrane serine protease [Proteobacteria bacterium]|nr:rhomboid family intramembrane serine protease [Pseudomonadota bacterium]
MKAPVTHADGSVRRQPWVSYALIVAMLVCFAVTQQRDAAVDPDTGYSREEAAVDAFLDAEDFFYETPRVELSTRMQRLVGPTEVERVREEERLERETAGLPLLPVLKPTQRRYREAEQRAFAELDSLPSQASGVRRGRTDPARLVVHPLFHGTWKHLLVSLVMLASVAMALEMVWGSGLFAAMVVLSSYAALALHLGLDADIDTPWQGATGIAAAAGAAYLIRFRQEGMRWFGVMPIPAILLVPAWVLAQAVWLPQLRPDGSFDFDLRALSLAPWGSLGGALFLGAVMALGMKLAGLDKSLEPERAASDVDSHPAVSRAVLAREAGRHDEALQDLSDELAKTPNHPLLIFTLWETAVEAQQPGRAAPMVLGFVRDAVRRGRARDVVNYWEGILEHAPDTVAEARVAVAMAEAMKGKGDDAKVAQSLRGLLQSDERMSLALARRVVRLAKGVDDAVAAKAASVALEATDLDDAERASLQELAAAAPTTPAPAAAPPAPAPELGATAPNAEPDYDNLDPQAIDLDGGETSEPEPDAGAASPFGDAGSVTGADPEELERWNDPGLVEDLSGELPDDDVSGFDADSLEAEHLSDEQLASLADADGLVEETGPPVEEAPAPLQDTAMGALAPLGAGAGEAPPLAEASPLTEASPLAEAPPPAGVPLFDTPAMADAAAEAEESTDEIAPSTLTAEAEASEPASIFGDTPPGLSDEIGLDDEDHEAPPTQIDLGDANVDETTDVLPPDAVASPERPPPPVTEPAQLGPQAVAEAVAPAAGVDVPTRSLRVIPAVPTAFRQDGLVLELEGRGRSRVPFDKIEAVSMAAVEGLAGKPVVVVDLALNWHAADQTLKVLRLRSDSFNPKRIVPGAPSSLEALRSFVSEVVAKSQAIPLPNAESVAGRPFAHFSDATTYHTTVLMASED